METSSVIAKILGIYLSASGAVLLFKRKTIPILLKDFFEHPAIMWLAGLVLIVLGGFMALSVTSESAGGLWITILGWLIILKGVFYIIFPEFMATKAARFPQHLFNIFGIIVIALGMWLLLLY